MSPSYETLHVAIDRHVATVSLNRPDKANAMNAAMWTELQSCFEFLDAQAPVRAVVLAGNGKHFCAGLDLTVFDGLTDNAMEAGRRAETLRRTILRMQDNLGAIERCRVPVLAAIHNTCIGGGVDMVCATDMRYATRDAYFSIREIDIGMTADVGTLQRFPKLVPDGMARELAYTGRNMYADEALALGFVNRLFDSREQLLEGVTAIAHEIAGKSPLAVRGSKEMLLYSRDHSVAEGLNFIATWNAGMLSEADLARGISAQFAGESAQYDD